MSVWLHEDDASAPDEDLIHRRTCRYCRGDLVALERYGPEDRHSTLLWEFHRETRREGGIYPKGRINGGLLRGAIETCPTCGWWSIWCYEDIGADMFGACGSLKQFDPADLSLPIAEVSDFLRARYEARFSLHPRLFEETVAAVFRDLGYEALVTGYQRDGGIDIVLEGPENTQVGVQVKRYRNRIGVAQVRELAGALMVHGMTRGIFVTTSDFTSGSSRTTEDLASRGVTIELMNATQFFDALRITRSKSYDSSSELVAALGRVPQPRYLGYCFELVD